MIIAAPAGLPSDADAWWRRGVIYQVYPRSFQDSNGDGVGDLAGIERRLDHLVTLGVDALWISPFYPSPMADFGYDVADYCDVDPRFGSLADFDRLIAAARARGLRTILDFVPNHSSDQHPWFRASRSSRDDPRRDWYIWRDPAPGGGPPNNWLSNFGGSAWTLDAGGQYYYHSFLAEQPDLNWRHPEVRRAMYDVMRFWLQRGVDGFRIDVVYHLIKDDLFRDNPPDPAFDASSPSWHRWLPLYTADRPEVLGILKEMRAVAASFDRPDHERLLIGELYLPLDRLVKYYGVEQDGAMSGVQLPFNFLLIDARWQAQTIGRIVRDYEAALPSDGWPNWVLGNHDKPRIASRVGPGQARIAAMLLLTLRGTPTLYYGDEIGMVDVSIPDRWIQDPVERREPGKGLGRDPQRTPMQWDRTNNAGFSTGSPWLPLADDWPAVNVAVATDDVASLLGLYERLIALRRRSSALSIGTFHLLHEDAQCLAYRRRCEDETLIVVLNFSAAEAPVPESVRCLGGDVLLSTSTERRTPAIVPARLHADEGLIIEYHASADTD